MGEQRIIDLLKNNNIDFIKEYTNHNCRFEDTNALARFDFYISKENYIIEFDGVQHYIEGQGYYDNSEQFQITQQHDKYKNQWCEQNQIPLIRIPYWHLDELKIKDLLLETTEYLI